MEGDRERGGAAGGGETAFGAQQPRVVLFELGHPLVRPAEPAAAAVDLEHLGFPGLAPLRPVQPTARMDGGATEEGGLVRFGREDRGRLPARQPAQGQ
jgi:hypothetical protein